MVDQTQFVLALGGIAVALVALILGIYAVVRVRVATRGQATVATAVAEGNFAAVIDKMISDIEAIHKTDERLDKAIKKTWRKSECAVQRVGLVRFDALDELAGQLSFSAALLNDSADGVVITSINGRTETRTYAKPIEKGASTFTLSDEERQAITKAMSESPVS